MPNGVISVTLYKLGVIPEPINFMAKGEYFYAIYTIISRFREFCNRMICSYPVFRMELIWKISMITMVPEMQGSVMYHIF